MVFVNGEQKEADNMVLADYLMKADFDLKKIAVELNGKIVPKADYENIVLRENDIIEVVSFVGGGWFEFWKSGGCVFE